jgi:hypothetical protein
MLLLTPLLTLFTLALALPNPSDPCTAAGYLPPDATPSRKALALLDLYTSPNCTADADTAESQSQSQSPAPDAIHCRLPIFDSGSCVPFMPGTQALRVVEADRKRLRYNSRK